PVPRISALAPDAAKSGWLGRRGVGLVASRQPTASRVAAMAVETRANTGVRWKGYILSPHGWNGRSKKKTEPPAAKATPIGLTRTEIRCARRGGETTAQRRRAWVVVSTLLTPCAADASLSLVALRSVRSQHPRRLHADNRARECGFLT